ncbi:MAG: BatD family protein [Flavobacteriales bacterium]
MEIMKRILNLAVAFVIASAPVVAQEVSFRATVDRNEISVGDGIRFTLELSNAPSGRLTTPDWGGMVVAQGPSTSNSFSNMNGSISRSSTTVWVLTATSPGDYTIGPSTASIGGGSLRTDPIKIHVSKGESSSGSNPQMDQAQKKDPNLFCTISLSKSKAYVGEQVIATYTLFSRYNTLQADDYDLPKLSGFWAEEVDLGDANWEPGQRTINGLAYRVAILKKQVLIPLRSGQLRIDPMTLNYRVNPGFFSSGTAVKIQSNASSLNVVDLPANKPADFMGAVGDLRLEMDAPAADVNANEAIDLTIRFSGRANLKLIDAPKLNLPGDFESYDPKIDDKITVNGAGMSGSRTFQYLLIPRHEGNYDIGALTFSYFDPTSGTYKQLKSPPMHFDVKPGAPNSNATVGAVVKTDVKPLANDIRYIRTGDLQLRRTGSFLFGSWPYVLGIGLPPLLLLVLFAWYRKREKRLGDTTGMRRRGADKVAKQRLALAKTALDAGDRSAFNDALGKALEGYAADKFNLGVAEVNPDVLRDKLASMDGGKTAEEYIALIATAEMARFSPADNKPRQQTYEEAAALIARIEQHVRA